MYGKPSSVMMPGRRRKMNLLAICLAVVVPWLSFISVAVALGFGLRFSMPPLAYLVFFGAMGYGVSLLAGALAASKHTEAVRSYKEPSWTAYLGLMVIVGALCGYSFAGYCYSTHMGPFYSTSNLNVYSGINPAQKTGRAVMDVGRAYFTSDSALDLDKAVGFKNQDLYCVVPITVPGSQQKNYDFWAVGTNCCRGLIPQFRCGEYANVNAKAGLRIVRDEDRPFYRLAVQQSEAANNITAQHPIFLTWVQDPVNELHHLRDAGMRAVTVASFAFFLFNGACAMLAATLYSKVQML